MIVQNLDSRIGVTISELRGHGGSWPPPENGSIELFARDVLSVAKAVGTHRFFVGGHSIGGMAALEAGNLAPDRVKGIIAIEGSTSSEASSDAFGNEHCTTLTPELDSRRRVIRESVTENWSEAQKKKFGRIWREWDGTSFLRSTSLPILEIWGDRGMERPTLDQLQVPDRDNIEVKWIPEASHSLTLEAPRRVAQAINAFIYRVGGKSLLE